MTVGRDEKEKDVPRKTGITKKLRDSLSKLEVTAGEAFALQHAGLNVPPKVWEDVYRALLQAHTVLAKTGEEK